LDGFVSLLHGYAIPLTEEEAEKLFSVIDLQGRGFIEQSDLQSTLIGVMNEERKQLIKTIFNFLDLEETGKLDIRLLKERYTPERAPEVIKRKRSAEDVKEEFEETLYLFCYELVMIKSVV
jgi:Ca2+-binding EF-hand superfamily protein